MDSIFAITEKVWRAAGGNAEALLNMQLTGDEPVLPSSFRMGAVAQSTIALAAMAAAEFFRLRTGISQSVLVDMRHACVDFRSERYFQVNGQPTPELWDRIAGAYQCGDEKWVRIHTNFPHHRDGVLNLLHCEYSKDSVQQALRQWQAEAFETAATARGLVVAMMRSFEEWDQHPHAAVLRKQPLLSIQRIGQGTVLPMKQDVARPLQGVRVLDLTRIIAGPVCTRVLAAHGADVLTVTSPHLPSIEAVIDTGRGKRTTMLDLRAAGDRKKLTQLVIEADILVQGYRPGGLAELGFGPEQAAKLNPGIIYVSLCAYGSRGPWAQKRGFDSLAQTAMGFNDAEAKAAGAVAPKPFPCQALDHGTGYLMAFAAIMALARRQQEGGAWHVDVSLAQTAQWLRGLGRLDNGLMAQDSLAADAEDFLEESLSGYGALRAVRHAAQLSATPAYFAQPSMPLGSHMPVWLER